MQSGATMVDDAATRQALSEAFAVFNDTSRALEASYRELEARVVDLTSRLAAADDARRRELEAREQLAQRLDALLTALPGGVLVLDECGRVETLNPAAQTMLGTAAGRTWDELAATLLRFGESPDELHLADGRCLSMTLRPLDGGSAVILLTDVTAARALQRQVARQQKLLALDAASARLAHDLRTPLAAAMLQVSRLASVAMPAPMARLAERALERLRHLQSLFDATLALAQGEVELNASCRLREVLADALAALDPALRQDLQLSIDVSPALAELVLHGQRALLAGALSQLLVNAAQAAPAGTVSVHAVREPGVLRIRVRDSGPGVPEVCVQRIFEPFYSTRRTGHGIGLASARAAARAHGGDVRLLPDIAPGACFELDLPLPAAALASGGSACAA